MNRQYDKDKIEPYRRGKCGRPLNPAYLELMKEDEDWRQLKDASERKKVQNRLAQRAYRRNLRNRNKEVETLEEQLMRFQEVDRQSANTIERNGGSKSKRKASSKVNSRGSTKSNSSRLGSKEDRAQSMAPSDATLSCEWVTNSYEDVGGRSTFPLGEGNNYNPRFFDSYQDSDDSISSASGSSPGHHPIQSGAIDMGIQIIYDNHTKLSPLPPAHDNMHYERGCSRSGEDLEQPMPPFHHDFDHESSATNHEHLEPIPQKAPPRYATPIELRRPVGLGGDEEDDSSCFGYNTASMTEPGGRPPWPPYHLQSWTVPPQPPGTIPVPPMPANSPPGQAWKPAPSRRY
ncbi:hypothetical protein PG994_003807 [Apiospora phragmitis]|uniref:BZIP domain-containing protein n=1 Tax=Apiospora phragmitis TaxID=2905665 RepID=A0ABR1W260_9PEZI